MTSTVKIDNILHALENYKNSDFSYLKCDSHIEINVWQHFLIKFF